MLAFTRLLNVILKHQVKLINLLILRVFPALINVSLHSHAKRHVTATLQHVDVILSIRSRSGDSARRAR